MYLHRTVRFIVGSILAAFVLAGAGLGTANAQAPTPAQLFQQNPNGGQLLINALEQLVLTNNAAFQPILGMVPSLNEQQKIATATALTQATKTLVLTNESLAAEWQRLILAITDQSFKTAALNAFGDVRLGAVGGGPLGGPLGGGGTGPAGTNSSLQDIRSNPTNTPGFTFGSGVGGATVAGGSFTTGTLTTSTSGSTGSSVTNITNNVSGNGNCGIGNGLDPSSPGGGGVNCDTKGGGS